MYSRGFRHLLGFLLFFGLTLLHLSKYFPQVADLIGRLSWEASLQVLLLYVSANWLILLNAWSEFVEQLI